MCKRAGHHLGVVSGKVLAVIILSAYIDKYRRYEIMISCKTLTLPSSTWLAAKVCCARATWRRAAFLG